MRAANRLNADTVIICGDNELEQGILTVKNMRTSEQSTLPLENLMEYCCN